MVGFSQFIRERQYLHNVTPATVEWYKHSFKWLRTESPAQDELKETVLRMREKGLKATGCNSAISHQRIPQVVGIALENPADERAAHCVANVHRGTDFPTS